MRQFCLGVLCWTPATLRLEATLNDIADAIEGNTTLKGGGLCKQRAAPPTRDFLRDMLLKHPDS
ncbi:MAG: hypothetical protein PW788_02635 [Micavibrio sp.]|nr:hypothetical protein [Micavibrio sp.]